jgi:DNA polymerase I-like protein with 3'-5' exonuclease and polymerase domains
VHTFAHFIISNLEYFDRLLSYESKLESDYPIVLDVETDNKDIQKANLYGIGICFTSKKAFYIPWRDSDGSLWWPKEQAKKIVSWLQSACQKRGIIGHNLVYDVLVIENTLGIVLDSFVHSDTILLKHTLDEEPPFALKEIAVNILGEWADLAQEQLKEEVISKGGRWVKDQKDMYLASTETLGKYCCWDVVLTRLVYEYYSPKLIEENLYELFYEQEVMPLYKTCTINMKRKGFEIDLEHFQNLKSNLESEISNLETEMYSEISEIVKPFEIALLDKNFPLKNSGNFPKIVADLIEAPLPINKDGKITLARKAVELQKQSSPEYSSFYDWVLGTAAFEDIESKFDNLKCITQKLLWKDKFNSDRVFNLSSNDHLIELFLNIKGYKALNTTDKGKPQIDEEFIDSLAKKDSFAKKLSTYKKYNKLLTTYINGILERASGNKIYTDMLQFGTTSGRFSSRNPNLQNLPRPIEEKDASSVGLDLEVLKYLNSIREGFVAPKGYVLVDADYSALEPRCLDKYTIVQTKDEYKYIKDVAIGEKINTKDGYKTIKNKWNSDKKVLIINTKKGALICSEDHKIFIKNRGFIKASEITVGDCLENLSYTENQRKQFLPIYFKNTKEHSRKPLGITTLNTDLSWVLGAFLGDGVCSNKNRHRYVGVCGIESDGVLHKFSTILNEYGIRPSSSQDRRTVGMKTLVYNDAWLTDVFKNTFKVLDQKKILRVPTYLLNSTKENKLSFLAGLIDTDGTVKSSEISISSKSIEFLTDLIVLTNELGLDGKINLAHKKLNEKIIKCYQLRFTAKSINTLYDLGINNFIVVKRKKLKGKIREINRTPQEPEVIEILNAESRNLIDITVEDNEEFIANGLRVHNCFAHVSQDETLRDVFRKGEDLYSRIAIDVFKVQGVSANPKDSNYLGILQKEFRQKSKVFCLAVPYGAEAARIAQEMNISWRDADNIVKSYLNAYPNLKRYMAMCNYEAKSLGFVKTEFGRVRHLPKAKAISTLYGDRVLDYKWAKKTGKEQLRRELKTSLNNSKNFKIQGLAAHIVNRAMIAVAEQFKKHNIEGYVVLQIHDQIVCVVRQDQAEQAKSIVKFCMENTTKISIPLIAEPKIAHNLKESH